MQEGAVATKGTIGTLEEAGGKACSGAEGCGFASEAAADCKLHPLEQRLGGEMCRCLKL
jgi:hypothetical protein